MLQWMHIVLFVFLIVNATVAINCYSSDEGRADECSYSFACAVIGGKRGCLRRICPATSPSCHGSEDCCCTSYQCNMPPSPPPAPPSPDSAVLHSPYFASLPIVFYLM